MESYTLPIAPGAEIRDLAKAHRIKVRPPPRNGLIALVSRSHDDAATESYLARLPVAERWLMGSSLKFCRIAEGLADIYPRLGETREWDSAAGHAILAAAGGDVTVSDGRTLHYGDAAAGLRRLCFVAVGGFRLEAGAVRLKT